MGKYKWRNCFDMALWKCCRRWSNTGSCVLGLILNLVFPPMLSLPTLSYPRPKPPAQNRDRACCASGLHLDQQLCKILT